MLLNNPFKVHESFYEHPELPAAIFSEVLTFVDQLKIEPNYFQWDLFSDVRELITWHCRFMTFATQRQVIQNLT